MKSPVAWIFSLLLLVGCGPDPVQVDYAEHDISTLQELIQSGDLSSEALTAYYLQRVDELDRAGPELRSIIELNPDALAIARALDEERWASGARGSMHQEVMVLYKVVQELVLGIGTCIAHARNARATIGQRVLVEPVKDASFVRVQLWGRQVEGCWYK